MPKQALLWCRDRITVSGKGTLLIGFFAVLFAFLPTTVLAGSIGEGFTGAGKFTAGTAVSINKDNPEDIALAEVANSDYLLGVVQESGDNLLTFSKDGSRVTVAVSGQVAVFASDANGVIKKGDFVGASWLQGVAMRSNVTDERKMLGVALEDFDVAAAKEYGEIETPSGKRSVKVAPLVVRLFDRETSPGQTAARTGLESFVNKLVGRDVSFARVLIGVLVFGISMVVCALFVYSAIRSSFISIGRNPLASSSIYSSLLHVSLLSTGIVLIGTSLAYIVLVV